MLGIAVFSLPCFSLFFEWFQRSATGQNPNWLSREKTSRLQCVDYSRLNCLPALCLEPMLPSLATGNLSSELEKTFLRNWTGCLCLRGSESGRLESEQQLPHLPPLSPHVLITSVTTLAQGVRVTAIQNCYSRVKTIKHLRSLVLQLFSHYYFFFSSSSLHCLLPIASGNNYFTRIESHKAQQINNQS